MPKIGIDIGYYNPRKIVPISFTDGTNSGGGYTSIMTDYITRVTDEGGTLTDEEKTAINLLTQNADIGEFDRLWIHGLSNQIAARISLVNALTADLITNVNSTTFTASEGFTGNGTTMYLDTNYNPSTNGVKYTLNNFSMGGYNTQNLSSVSQAIIGGGNGANAYADVVLKTSTSELWSDVNTGGAMRSTLTDSSGLITVARTTSNLSKQYAKGVELPVVSGNTQAALNIPNVNLYLLGNNFGGLFNQSSNTLALSFIGSGAIDQTQFYTDVQTLGTTLGWAV